MLLVIIVIHLQVKVEWPRVNQLRLQLCAAALQLLKEARLIQVAVTAIVIHTFQTQMHVAVVQVESKSL